MGFVKINLDTGSVYLFPVKGSFGGKSFRDLQLVKEMAYMIGFSL